MNTFAIAYGFRLAPVLAPPSNLADPAAVLAQAALLERLADLHQNEGRTSHADRLSHLATELRCRAIGNQA